MTIFPDEDDDLDLAKLELIKKKLSELYVNQPLPSEPDLGLSRGILSGPRTRQEYEKRLKELDEAAGDDLHLDKEDSDE